MQQYYNQHQDDYRIPETVTVRHILIKTPTPDADGKVDQKGVDAARTKAEDIEKQLKGGANFADLAKKYSEDPGSAKDGGLLPPITRGRTVPEFEQAPSTRRSARRPASSAPATAFTLFMSRRNSRRD